LAKAAPNDPMHTARGVHCTHRRQLPRTVKPRGPGEFVTDRQADRQTPQTIVIIVCISCIGCRLKTKSRLYTGAQAATKLQIQPSFDTKFSYSSKEQRSQPSALLILYTYPSTDLRVYTPPSPKPFSFQISLKNVRFTSSLNRCSVGWLCQLIGCQKPKKTSRYRNILHPSI